MHQHKGAVYKISKDVYQFTVVPVLEIFPGKIIVFCFRRIGAKYITQYIFTTGKIFYVFIHPYSPVAAEVETLSPSIFKNSLAGTLSGNTKSTMRFQHCRKNDAMKNNIIFSNKMNQFCIFFAPVICPFISKFFCGS